MQKFWEQLDSLKAIVDTTNSDEIELQSETIRKNYEPYASLYFVTEDVKRLEEKLVKEIREGHSVVGYISADYGYGKTATSVYLWKKCLDAKIVAVPPFRFEGLKNIMQATKGWLLYQLKHTYPDLIQELNNIYDKYKECSIEELAEHMASREDIPKTKAIRIVQNYISKSKDITPEILLQFLRDVTELAKAAGFKGLIVFADETQDFLRTEESRAREAIQTLSTLVKGIRGMANVPFGLMLSMPVNPTETAIEEQAGDILHRMREKGTSLKLEGAYGRDFPKQLWEHLCDYFDDDETYQAIEERTLDSLGQICERKDLSNGPRTVISVLKSAAHHWHKNYTPYTPINMIDDYLNGNIVFEGKEAKLTGTIRPLLDTSAVKDVNEGWNAIKLLAAFPRGVDKEKAKDLYPVIEEIAEKYGWLGEHITQLSEGYALIGLQEQESRGTLLDEIIRGFRRRWYQIWDDDTKLGLAAYDFHKDILKMIFPSRQTGQYYNFSGHEKSKTSPQNIKYIVLAGSFESLFSKFPDRRVCVAVSTDKQELNRFKAPSDEIDVIFHFFLESPETDSVLCRIESANRDPRIDIHLNLKNNFGSEYPPELRFLQDIMSPEHASAQVLLALSRTMSGWLEGHPDTSEADKQMIEANMRTLRRYATQLLLPPADKVQARGIKVKGTEQRLIEYIFEQKCTELYPEYKPLMVTKEWKGYLRHYRDALGKRPLAERRGKQDFIGDKEKIAQTFGWSKSALESPFRILEQMYLLEYKKDKETGFKVSFKEHPLEKLLIEILQNKGRNKIDGKDNVKVIEVSRLYENAGKQGYLKEEVDEAIELLILRQYIQRNPDGTVQELAGKLDAEELKSQAKELRDKFIKLLPYFKEEIDLMIQNVREAEEHLKIPDDEIALDTAKRKLDEVKAREEQFLVTKKSALVSEFDGFIHELERLDLNPPEITQQVTGTVDFVRHVDDQRKKLEKNFRDLNILSKEKQINLNNLKTRLQSLKDTSSLLEILEKKKMLEKEKKHLEKESEDLKPYVLGLQRWREIVTNTSSLREQLELQHPLRRKLDEEFGTHVMENFATRELEGLLDWERFKTDLDTINAEYKAEESRIGNKFLKLKEQYEQVLGSLISQRMTEVPVDTRNIDVSYQMLYNEAQQKVHGWLEEKFGDVNRLVSEFQYLIRERNIPAKEELDSVLELREEIQEASKQLNLELVEDINGFGKYSGELKTINQRLIDLRNKLREIQIHKEPPSEEEKPLMEILSIQRKSLEDLRHQLSPDISLDVLFDNIKNLYRKGHLEIELRRRD